MHEEEIKLQIAKENTKTEFKKEDTKLELKKLDLEKSKTSESISTESKNCLDVKVKCSVTEEVTADPYTSWEHVTERLVEDGYIGDFNY